MPTYVYKGTECDHRFEAVQGFHDDPLDTCTECGGPARRVIGNVGVTFKGSGFYRTDSRSGSSSSPKSSSKPADSSTKSADSSSTTKKSDSSSSSTKD